MNLIKQIVKPGEYGTQTIKMVVRSNERGAQGEQGPKGDAATITAGNAYSVEEGQSPAVINTGTSSDAVFDFYLPKGPKGDDGAIHYTAGTGINITSENVIEATGDATAAWGGIQGNITNQTDLRNEFALYTKTADLPDISTAYVGTDNLVDGAVIASKLAQYATNFTIITADNLAPGTDTPAGWKTLFGGDGYYVTQYDTASKFANQPAQYGQLTTIITGDQVFQKFFEDNSVVWIRGAGDNDWDIYTDGRFRIVHDGRTAFVGQGPIIPDYANLNSTDYIIPGEYTATGGAAPTLSNCPTSNGFRLVVESISRVLRLDATTKGARLLRVLIDMEGIVYIQNVQSDNTPTWTYGPWRAVVDDKTFFTAQIGSIIPANADLNTIAYVQPGVHTANRTLDVPGFSNCPTTVAFRMEVTNVSLSDVVITSSTKWVTVVRKLTDTVGAVFVQTVNSNGDNTPTWTYGPWHMITAGNGDGTVGIDNILTIASGYTADEYYFYRQGKLLYLNVMLHKNSGTFGGGETVATIKKSVYYPAYPVNYMCALAINSMWTTNTPGYLYISSDNGQIIVGDATAGCSYAKITLTYPIA